MIFLKHYGIYVEDLVKEESFYEHVFNMSYICRQETSYGEFDFLINSEHSEVMITKLITEYGRETGIGDMLELIKVVSPKMKKKDTNSRVFETGVMHLAVECNIEETLKKVEEYGGFVSANPHEMKNGNLMAFVQDPEGNYIELIERRVK